MLSIIKKILNRQKHENTSPTLEDSIEAALKNILPKIIEFKTLLEIGSRDGHDANRLSKLLNINKQDVYVIEANPDSFEKIKAEYPSYNVFNVALFNKEGFLDFNKVYKDNIGTSSILNRNDNYYTDKSEKIKVKTITGERFFKEYQIPEISLCKIDVEGATLEVLESFLEQLQKIKLIHLESEHKEVWTNQKLYSDIKDYLTKLNFKEVYFEYVSEEKLQSDSIWLNEN